MSADAALHDLVRQVRAEALRADARYGPFTSTHEGFGVLAEEVAELLEAIRANDGTRIRAEACQVAAVALRLAAATAEPACAARSNLTEEGA